MYSPLRYRTFANQFIFGLFLSIFVANAAGCCYWFLGGDAMAIELNDGNDSESEKEEHKHEKDTKDKVPVFAYELNNDLIRQLSKAMLLSNFFSYPTSDIVTPPPENNLL